MCGGVSPSFSAVFQLQPKSSHWHALWPLAGQKIHNRESGTVAQGKREGKKGNGSGWTRSGEGGEGVMMAVV